MVKKLDNKGNASIYICMLVLIISMVIMVAMQFIRIQLIGYGVETAMKESVKHALNVNWDETFGGSRQGYTGGYLLNTEILQEHIGRQDVMDDLAELLNLNRNGTRYAKQNGDSTEFVLYDFTLDIKNSPFATDNSSKFEVTASASMEISFAFMQWEYPLTIHPRVKVYYSPLF